MKVAAVQMDIRWHDRSANLEKARTFALEAKKAGADLLIFPEMFSTGFSMDTSTTAEPLNGPTPTLLRSLGRELQTLVVGGFVLACEQGKPQNVVLAVDQQGKDLSLYAKTHLISILGESDNYAPGEGPAPFRLDGMEACCFICYDLRFPELFRSVADNCGLIMVVASWPAERQSHWDILLPARAVENQCYVVGVNRVGQGGGHTFTGGSAIIDPLGQIVAHGGEKEILLIADIDPSIVAEVRQ
ncbi:MAG: hypothetical protein JRI89_17530, partial [Deltaproteobacteria bacterium]|nr:hypothetical protein [Deltaproteobacteria bacterium]